MLRLLAAVAWSDGELADSEAAALGRLINAAELDEDERSKARIWLTSAVDIDTVDVDSLNQNQRLATYQAALRMALSDEKLAESERAFLDRARETLGIDEAQAAELEAEMPQHD